MKTINLFPNVYQALFWQTYSKKRAAKHLEEQKEKIKEQALLWGTRIYTETKTKVEQEKETGFFNITKKNAKYILEIHKLNASMEDVKYFRYAFSLDQVIAHIAKSEDYRYVKYSGFVLKNGNKIMANENDFFNSLKDLHPYIYEILKADIDNLIYDYKDVSYRVNISNSKDVNKLKNQGTYIYHIWDDIEKYLKTGYISDKDLYDLTDKYKNDENKKKGLDSFRKVIPVYFPNVYIMLNKPLKNYIHYMLKYLRKDCVLNQYIYSDNKYQQIDGYYIIIKDNKPKEFLYQPEIRESETQQYIELPTEYKEQNIFEIPKTPIFEKNIELRGKSKLFKSAKPEKKPETERQITYRNRLEKQIANMLPLEQLEKLDAIYRYNFEKDTKPIVNKRMKEILAKYEEDYKIDFDIKIKTTEVDIYYQSELKRIEKLDPYQKNIAMRILEKIYKSYKNPIIRTTRRANKKKKKPEILPEKEESENNSLFGLSNEEKFKRIKDIYDELRTEATYNINDNFNALVNAYLKADRIGQRYASKYGKVIDNSEIVNIINKIDDLEQEEKKEELKKANNTQLGLIIMTLQTEGALNKDMDKKDKIIIVKKALEQRNITLDISNVEEALEKMNLW